VSPDLRRRAGRPGAVPALASGLGAAARNARLLIWLLIANVALAVAGVWPLLRPFEESLEWHPAAGEMMRRFDMAWWVDLTTAHAEAFARTIELAGLVAFLSVLTGCFFSGGLLQAYDDTFEGRRMDRFLQGCRRWFPRFLRLFVFSLPLYWLVHRVANFHLAFVVDDLLEEVDDERVGIALMLAKSVLFLLLFNTVTLCVAYARAHAIVTSSRSMLVSLRAGILFVLRHPIRVWSLEGLAILLQTGALMIYLPVDALFTRNGAAGLMAGVIAGQFFILARLFLREGARAGHLALFRARSAGPAGVAAAPVERADQAAA